jgi:hypothetical protein
MYKERISLWCITPCAGTGRRTKAVFLSGASRGRLTGGSSVLAGLSMHLPPDSNVTMSLVGWPAQGSSAQVSKPFTASTCAGVCVVLRACGVLSVPATRQQCDNELGWLACTGQQRTGEQMSK